MAVKWVHGLIGLLAKESTTRVYAITPTARSICVHCRHFRLTEVDRWLIETSKSQFILTYLDRSVFILLEVFIVLMHHMIKIDQHQSI